MPIELATNDAVEIAARAIRSGQLVAFPTETVYGLGADATCGLAVAKIYEAKQRPSFNPLIIHVLDLQTAAQYGNLNILARRLAETFWPGPLTVVVPRTPQSKIAELATAGLETIALRVPAHPVACALLRQAAGPIAAPSANRSGHVSPTSAAHVCADLGDAPAFILDGGPTPLGLESTIVAVRDQQATLLRAGAITRDELQSALGQSLLEPCRGGKYAPAAPGQLARHYAPRSTLRLNAAAPGIGEAWLAFGAVDPAHQGAFFNLSPSGDLREAAANLFAALRELDASAGEAIAVSPIPETGLGEAINDRLRRGAAPNPSAA